MRTELTTDAAVVGAGPAGAATALLLAGFCRTLLVDRAEADGGTPAAPIGDRCRRPPGVFSGTWGFGRISRPRAMRRATAR